MTAIALSDRVLLPSLQVRLLAPEAPFSSATCAAATAAMQACGALALLQGDWVSTGGGEALP